MSKYTVFMVAFVAVVLVLGLVIFFYWRSQYGVWAQQRKKRSAEGRDGTVESQTIKYD